ncbi:HAMP domain-containing protein [Rhodococcus sp. D2-41]|nr:HAMP domain-containing protein [Rhodococcus sp. D2-41]
MLQANVVGAVGVIVCVRILMPVIDVPSSFTTTNTIIFAVYLAVGVIVGGVGGVLLIYPVLAWQRRGGPVAPEVRLRAMRIPALHAVLHGVLWLVGIALFVLAALPAPNNYALTIGIAGVLGGITTCAVGYLQAERLLRPIAAAALSDGVLETANAPSVSRRIMLAWLTCTGIPVVGIVVMVAGYEMGILVSTPDRVQTVVLIVAAITLAVGFLTFRLAGAAIGDPIRQLRHAQQEVERGNLQTSVQIFDGSELGILQAGFNDLVAALSERQQLRDLFGRYVGEDVARRALERGTELGGEERDVAVLFVDLVGSTRLASTNPPQTVVALLNDFFREIVDVVDRHGGFVNKFQGDAALAIFGAPIGHPDAPGGALAAARELEQRLELVLGPGEFGIGVSAGRAVAGHIGAAARFEFTVIGDPVNEAARLTELAKHEPRGVLASAAAVQLAGDTEAFRWEVDETVQLRGRRFPTQLARPREALVG